MPADETTAASPSPRYEDAIKRHEPLSLYESGLVEGLRMYSWMKDGVTYVGTTGTTLGRAVDKAITEARELWPTTK